MRGIVMEDFAAGIALHGLFGNDPRIVPLLGSCPTSAEAVVPVCGAPQIHLKQAMTGIIYTSRPIHIFVSPPVLRQGQRRPVLAAAGILQCDAEITHGDGK